MSGLRKAVHRKSCNQCYYPCSTAFVREEMHSSKTILLPSFQFNRLRFIELGNGLRGGSGRGSIDIV